MVSKILCVIFFPHLYLHLTIYLLFCNFYTSFLLFFFNEKISFINFNELAVSSLKDFSHLQIGSWSQALMAALTPRVPTSDSTRAGKSCWAEQSPLENPPVVVRSTTNLNQVLKRKLSSQPHWNLDSAPK